MPLHRAGMPAFPVVHSRCFGAPDPPRSGSDLRVTFGNKAEQSRRTWRHTLAVQRNDTWLLKYSRKRHGNSSDCLVTCINGCAQMRLG